MTTPHAPRTAGQSERRESPKLLAVIPAGQSRRSRAGQSLMVARQGVLPRSATGRCRCRAMGATQEMR